MTDDIEDTAARIDEQAAALAAALATAQIAERAGAERTAAATAMPDESQAAAGQPDLELARHARIAVAAYLLAERRGFEPGSELDDWLAAEREVDAGAPAAGER